jgi:hypothetical protein
LKRARSAFSTVAVGKVAMTSIIIHQFDYRRPDETILYFIAIDKKPIRIY